MATKRASGSGGARKRSTAAKRGTRARSSAKRGTGKRELVEPRKGDKRYARRTAKGTFTENQDDVSRSLRRDVKSKARKTARAGQGDEGDRKRGARGKKSARTKSGRGRGSSR